MEMEILFLVIGLVILAASALRWGADSRYESGNPELEQLQSWQVL